MRENLLGPESFVACAFSSPSLLSCSARRRRRRRGGGRPAPRDASTSHPVAAATRTIVPYRLGAGRGHARLLVAALARPPLFPVRPLPAATAARALAARRARRRISIPHALVGIVGSLRLRLAARARRAPLPSASARPSSNESRSRMKTMSIDLAILPSSPLCAASGRRARPVRPRAQWHRFPIRSRRRSGPMRSRSRPAPM